jgi:hypothetical protein
MLRLCAEYGSIGERMRLVISLAWLVTIICGAGISSAYADRFDAYFLDESRLPEMESVGIGPTSNAWEIYGQFAKRFVVVSPAEGQPSPPDIRRITEAGGGDRNALVFLLLNLFRWNGIDAELTLVSGKRGTKSGTHHVEHLLVYVPSLKQYFDPTLSPAAQPKSSERAWLDGRRRMHLVAALWHSGKLIGSCSSSCMHAYGGNLGSGSPLPYAVRVKTIQVPGSNDRDGKGPKQ